MARESATRSRILEEARCFANEVGFDRLTTRELAARCGMNEGNLYYHFKTKGQLVSALFTRFDAETRALFVPGPVVGRPLAPAELGKAIEDSVGLLRGWCVLSWHYRALMRDGNALFRLAPECQTDAMALNATLSRQVTALVEALNRARALSIKPADIPALVANIFIVSSYWLGYVIHQTGVSDPDDTHLAWGFGQIMALVAPYRTWMTRRIMGRHPEMFAYSPAAVSRPTR